MARAFSDGFKQGAKRIVLVGADIPELSHEILTEAIRLLGHRDVVIGPAEDGGYYLIGMRKFFPAVFHDIPWGTSVVYHTTVHRLEASGIGFAKTKVLFDMDNPEDLSRLDMD